MVAIITLTPEDIRNDFPEFSDLEKYTDAVLQNFINQSQCYISNRNYGVLRNGCRKYGLELMVAHLIALRDKINSGQAATGQVSSSSIDSVSVSLVAPPSKTMFNHWLTITPYGLQYLALLLAKAPAGIYYGGSFQRVLR